MKVKNTFLRKVTPLALAGSLIFSSTPIDAEAKREKTEKVYEIDGFYTMNQDSNPIYLFLENKVPNYYLEKNEAVSMMSKYYENVYCHHKITTQFAFSGGKETGKIVEMYALSPNYYEEGWGTVDIDKVKDKTMIATSIEMGNIKFDEACNRFQDLIITDYDLNNNGEKERVAFLNDGEAYQELTLTEAIKYAEKKGWQPFFVLRRVVLLSSGERVYRYIISNHSEVKGKDGWLIVNENALPKNTIVATSHRVYDGMHDMVDTLGTLRMIGDNTDDNLEEDFSDIDEDDLSYRYKSYNKALKYAYKHYEWFGIVTRKVYDPDMDEVYDVYALLTDPSDMRKGWKYIAEIDMPKDAVVFLDIYDAVNYLYLVDEGKQNILIIK